MATSITADGTVKLILPRFGGSCALCVDGLGCGGNQTGYCPQIVSPAVV